MARVAVVTGGTRGIGKAIAVALKKAGYKVAAAYQGNEAAAKACADETGIATFKFDVADFAQCEAGVKKSATELGPVDILVNNAGITRDGTIHKMTPQQWTDVINTNLTSCFNMCRCVIDGITKALAQEGAGKGITVNAIAPGYIDTEMVRAVPEDVLKKIVARIPVGRLGKADEIARGVLFLVADDAGFITGSTLSINGGQHMY